MRALPFLAALALCVSQLALPTVVAAQDLSDPSSLDCASLAAQSAALKTELRDMNSGAGRSAQRQADAQKATAVTALAGQAAASFVGVVGVMVSEGAQEVQRAQVGSALNNAREKLARNTALSRRIQALEGERSRRCDKDSQK